MSERESRLHDAAAWVRNAPEDGDFKLSNDDKLKMYGRYLQAIDNDIRGKKPACQPDCAF